MKHSIGVFVIAGLMFAYSCMPPTRLGSSSIETYLKTSVEKHTGGEFSSIKLMAIYNGLCFNGRSIELTGFKYNNKKGMVLAGSNNPSPQQGTQQAKPEAVKTEGILVVIDEIEARMILDNYKKLLEKIKADKPGFKETVFQDFTVNDELFISYCRTYSAFQGTSGTYVDLWIKGNKFTMYSVEFIKRMEEFIAY
jgi:hypothetical protein